MERRSTKGFMKSEVSLSTPCWSLIGLGIVASLSLLFLHSLSKYLLRAFLMPGQTLGNEEGIVLRDLTVQLGNAIINK